MKLIRECELRHARQIRHTMVQGRDEKFYKILSQQLYERHPSAEFFNYEVVVNEVDDQGRMFVLVMPWLKRFKTRDDAVRHHEFLLDHFDDQLNLAAKVEKHAKPKVEGAPAQDPAGGHG